MAKFVTKPLRLIIKFMLVLTVSIIGFPIFILSYFRYCRVKNLRPSIYYYILVSSWFFIKTKKVFNHKNKDYNTIFTDYKIQSKIFYNNSEIVKISDKILFKDYIKNKGYDVNPVVSVIRNYSEFLKYSNKKGYVFKCNHDSGSVVFSDNVKCSFFDYIFLAFLKNINYGIVSSEWQYIPIDRKVFVERKIEIPNTDYKIFCVNGEAKIIHCIYDRDGLPKQAIFDKEGNRINYDLYPGYVQKKNAILPNHVIEKIKSIELLSKEYRFIRIDIYSDENMFYIGEFTLTPQSGIYLGKGRDKYLEILNLPEILWVK